MENKKRVLKTLSVKEKVAIIREVEKGVKKKSQIAKDFGIPPSTLSTFLKNKDAILKNSEACGTQKRIRGPDHPDLDECVLKWFQQTREKRISLSGLMIRAKAEEFALSLGRNDFKASSGWLDGFKERNGICFKTVSGESGDVNQQLANDWKRDLLVKIQGKDPKDIFNADETGLFYRCIPNKTLAFKGERCSGGKLSKERITLLIGANMDGSEKLPLFMIGKSANRKAWMTNEIFKN